MRLKLASLPRGTNRNRMQRRGVVVGEDEADPGGVDRLFARFWRRWRLTHGTQGAPPGAQEGQDHGGSE